MLVPARQDGLVDGLFSVGDAFDFYNRLLANLIYCSC
jgi:hypothetical protein